jgi:hypothetical protein
MSRRGGFSTPLYPPSTSREGEEGGRGEGEGDQSKISQQ